jgi:DNA-binding transcriptional ArsR family regulator
VDNEERRPPNDAMEIVLYHSEEEGRITLTDQTPDGRLAVRIAKSRRYRDGYFAPEDTIGEPPYAMELGEYVIAWASEAIRSDAGINAALRFLHQSPEHSDIDKGDLAEIRAEKERLLAAAGSLFEGEKTIDEMTAGEIREAIDRWRERLSDFVPDSDEARILTLRIETATAWLRRF